MLGHPFGQCIDLEVDDGYACPVCIKICTRFRLFFISLVVYRDVYSDDCRLDLLWLINELPTNCRQVAVNEVWSSEYRLKVSRHK